MKNFFELLYKNPESETAVEISALSSAYQRDFKKGELIFCAGDKTNTAGLVLKGGVSIESIDLWGNRSILSFVGEGSVFAETYALCGEPLMVDAAAAEDCRVLFINLNRLLSDSNRSKAWYTSVMRDLLWACSEKNLTLSNRIFCSSSKSARRRIMSYLSSEAKKQGKNDFLIPFDRSGMADFLNLERTALSKELGRMRNEGLIDFKKNRFIIKNEK